ncbi:putative ribonuclease H-like domain-containing protein, partial [Tanacetum coccineum]
MAFLLFPTVAGQPPLDHRSTVVNNGSQRWSAAVNTAGASVNGANINDNQTNDRFKKDNGYHAVPPPLTGNYMPPFADLSFAGLDDSVYRPTENKTSASVSQVEASITPPSNTSVEMPRVESVRPSRVIIEDWVSDDDEDIFQSDDLQSTDKPSFKRIEFTNAKNESVKPKQAKKPWIITQNPKVYRRDWNGKMTQKLGLGFGFTMKASPNTRISNEKVNTVRVNGVNTARQTTVSTVKETRVTAVKASTGYVWRPKMTNLNNVSKDNSGSRVSKRGNPQHALKNKGIFDSGCSRHMTGNKDFLIDYQDINEGFVAFGGSAIGGNITGKGKIRTDKLDFKDVFFVKELKFNLFSISQMCDKKNNVLFTETECLVLSPYFKLLDASQVLLRVPKQSNMYSFDLKNVVPSGDLTCLPLKIFENDHTCVACQKGKQHKASYKAKLGSSISQPLQMLHMDLFGPTSIRSINHKTYCFVVTDDFSRFSWVFFLAFKDETSGILKRFITEIENQLNHKVKVIRCDNEIKFKNREMNEFCRLKGIKREFSVAKTSQQNRVAKRKNKTLIETARTMLADSLLPIVFWAEALNTACYVLRNQTNKNAGLQEANGDTADDAAGETPIQKPASENEQALKNVFDKMMDQEKEASEQSDAIRKEFEARCNRELLQGKATKANSTNSFNIVSTPVNAASAPRTSNDVGPSFVSLGGSFPLDFNDLLDYPLMPDLEDTAEVPNTGIFGSAFDDEDLDTYNSPFADQ